MDEAIPSNATTLDWVASTLKDKLPAEVDTRHCSLLGPVGLGVQALMGAIVLLSLLLRRARERPRRPWKIFTLDVSKQILGQAFVHGSNVLIAGLIAKHSKRESNPCSVYLLNIIVDTTFGVALLYLFLRGLTHIVIDRLGWDGFVSGFYDTPPKLSFWLRQLSIYILAISLMKTCVVTFLATFPSAYKAGHFLLGWLSGHADAQVIFSILIVPTIMNVLQFLIIDSFIRDKHASFQLIPDEETGQAVTTEEDNFNDGPDEQKTPASQSQVATENAISAHSSIVDVSITQAQQRITPTSHDASGPAKAHPSYGTSDEIHQSGKSSSETSEPVTKDMPP